VASVLSVQHAVSVPLTITTPGQPNIASTIWRTVADQKDLVYYFDSATRPNTNGEVFSGDVADQFKNAEPFKFLPASP
jgi:penicillin V acylase-like amidase (Ntn superfamily)